MKAVKVMGIIVGIVLVALFAGYFGTVSNMPLGQPRLMHLGKTRILVETVPSYEAGYWSQPVYAETVKNGVLKRVVAGHSVRFGRLNFYAVGH